MLLESTREWQWMNFLQRLCEIMVHGSSSKGINLHPPWRCKACWIHPLAMLRQIQLIPPVLLMCFLLFVTGTVLLFMASIYITKIHQFFSGSKHDLWLLLFPETLAAELREDEPVPQSWGDCLLVSTLLFFPADDKCNSWRWRSYFIAEDWNHSLKNELWMEEAWASEGIGKSSDNLGCLSGFVVM